MHNTDVKNLRERTASVVNTHLGRLAGERRFHVYHAFKVALSHECGWDAPNDRYDMEEYERGLAEFIDQGGF